MPRGDPGRAAAAARIWSAAAAAVTCSSVTMAADCRASPAVVAAVSAWIRASTAGSGLPAPGCGMLTRSASRAPSALACSVRAWSRGICSRASRSAIAYRRSAADTDPSGAVCARLPVASARTTCCPAVPAVLRQAAPSEETSASRPAALLSNPCAAATSAAAAASSASGSPGGTPVEVIGPDIGPVIGPGR